MAHDNEEARDTVAYAPNPGGQVGGGGMQSESGSSYKRGFNDALKARIDPIDDIFTYHSPTQEQLLKYQAIREAAKYFARIVITNTPYCADQKTAIRKLREAVMTANAAIALDGRSL